ncbi:hypothetical protein [Dokdonella soli]|uniref:Anti-sigma factor n=1 Tax=Dokdonella soli TaxID=529810 RepID=A0ABN1IG51_9GAMM
MRDNPIQTARGNVDLQRLPVFAPDPALWPRVAALQQRHLRAQRWRHGGFALAAAAAVCAAVIGLPRPQPSLQQELAAGQRESQVLESEWQRLASPARPDVAGMMRVRLIDAALQSAYDRGAGANELAPLWRQRNQALRGLIATLHDTNTTDALAVTRI